MDQVFDVAVIGGGINGCSIAADAAMRGLSVILLEKDDLASKTSSSSSKLIHGGLRYLEYYNFSLVKKALQERQRLLDLAPHLVRPIPFVLPYQPTIRSSWLLRAGLFLYDNLSSKNTLPRSKVIQRSSHKSYFAPFGEYFNKGVVFYDCMTDDARLTISNALQAKQHGALVHPGWELLVGEIDANRWQLHVKKRSGEKMLIKAQALINATGPWVESVNQRLKIPSQFKMALVKGSHLVVPKLYEGDYGYVLQHCDKRIVFLLPYYNHTVIGTTDIAFHESLEKVVISSLEVNYLLSLVNRYVKTTLQKDDILQTWSGIRPLLAQDATKPQALSRSYSYAYTTLPAPALTVYSGKITTYRQLAAEAVDKLKTLFPRLPPSKTHALPLPGARRHEQSYQDYVNWVEKKHLWLEASLKHRYVATYGTRTELLLNGCKKMADLGQHFGHGLYQLEVDYLRKEEWAHDCDDVLWRRTKLGLKFSDENKKKLAKYLKTINFNE